jgi:branched-subunit amino acid ABC-type transport system permease component
MVNITVYGLLLVLLILSPEGLLGRRGLREKF